MNPKFSWRKGKREKERERRKEKKRKRERETHRGPYAEGKYSMLPLEGLYDLSLHDARVSKNLFGMCALSMHIIPSNDHVVPLPTASRSLRQQDG